VNHARRGTRRLASFSASSDGEPLSWQRLQADGDRAVAAGGHEAHPPVCQPVLCSKELVDLGVRTRDRVRSVTPNLAVPFDLDDGVSIEPREPICACAVKPRRPRVIHDPQPRLLPATIGEPGAQRDDFATELDESEMAHDKQGAEGDDPTGKQQSLHRAA
jgi:hypothetical protein